MYKDKDIIVRFKINENTLTIECVKYNLNLVIIDGSIDIDISTESGDRIGLSELNENDEIFFLYREYKENNIKPLKIIKNSRYELIISSDEEDLNIDI